LAQFTEATTVLFLFKWFAFDLLANPAVNYVVTKPGAKGIVTALPGEFVLSFIIITIVLLFSNSKWAKATGFVAGLLVFIFIVVKAPLSGISMNPARSFASAAAANSWNAFYIYIIAPVSGMQVAAFFLKVYLVIFGKCKSMRTHMSGLKHYNPVYKVLCWYHLSKNGAIQKSVATT